MKKKIYAPLVLAITLIIFLQSYLVYAPANKVQTPPTISYGGSQYIGGGGYTYTYYVTSGDPVVKKWQLHSTCFKHNGPTITVEAEDDTYGVFTPDWNMNKAQHFIEFKHESKQKFTDGLTRTYRITVWSGYYSPMTTADVDYSLKWPPGKDEEGKISGPVCPPDFVIDESPLGTLGILIPLGAALTLFAFTNKRGLFLKSI